jgi:hypothetical protein
MKIARTSIAVFFGGRTVATVVVVMVGGAEEL